YFQTRWYQPFRQGGGNLLEHTVQPGTYNFRIVNPTDAALLYPSLTQTQLNQVYTGWTFNSPWVSSWLAFDVSAASNPNEPQRLYASIGYDPNNGGALAYPDAQTAYQAAKTGNSGTVAPWYNQFFAGEAFHSPLVTQYTFATPETLIFAVPDWYLPD